MPALPGFLFDRYNKYKADTDTLTQWLAETATSLGYQLRCDRTQAGDALKNPQPPAPQPRLKGKARKQARMQSQSKTTPAPANTIRKKIQLAELLPLADFIAASKSITGRVPKAIISVAQRAIEVRKRFADWFQSREEKTAEDVENDRTHQHFIEVLEKVVETLSSTCREKGGSNKTVKRPQGMPLGWDAAETGGRAAADGRNRFGLLDTELESDDDSEEQADPVKRHTHSPPTIRSPITYVFQSDSDDSDDMIPFFCFFEDLNVLLTYLQGVWEDYKSDTIDLITASLTTNSALELARSIYQSVIAGTRFDKPDTSYRDICHALIGCPCDVKFEDNKPDCINNICTAVGVGGSLAGRFLLTLPYHALRCYYVGVKPYHPHPKAKQTLIFMRDTFEYFDFLCHFQHVTNAEDEISNEICHMFRTDRISLLAVFACQVFADIHEVLGEKAGKGYDDLHISALAARQTLNEIQAAMQSPRTRNEFFDYDTEALERMQEGLRREVFQCFMADLIQMGKTKDFDPIPFFLQQHTRSCVEYWSSN
ncbi:hypothetical protein HDV00_002294 [Rhizophlyctis rosea]|nr:hypothetical protein HDV00_002294 [Rhizophlyctis rosea]